MLHILIVLTPLYITLFWSVIFLTENYNDNKARYWLGFFMLMTAILYGCHATFFLNYTEIYLKLDPVYLLMGLSVYPMYYIYIRLLTCDVNPQKNYLFHFIPSITLSILLFLTTLYATETDKNLYFNSVLLNNNWPEGNVSGIATLMSAIFFASRFIFGLQVFIYLTLGYQLAKKYNERISNIYSNLEGRELIWVNMLSISFFLTSILSMVVNFIGRGFFMRNDLYLVIPSVLFSAFFFVIGLQGYKQNHTIIQDLATDEKNETEFTEIITKQSILKSDLENLLRSKKLYLNPDLRINELCPLLTTNRTYLSKLINNDFGLTFNEFINQYRVDFSVELLKADITGNESLQHIAEKSGFGSLSSFNRAFKKEKNVTPGEFRKSIIPNSPD